MPINDTLFDQGGAVYNVLSTASGLGMKGDGSVDDGSKFYALNSGQHYVVPKGTYRFDNSGTIPAGAALGFMNGALLQPNTGATITIAGPIEAGPYQIFDFSLGGSVRFTGNGCIEHYLPQWFGVKGDNTVNEVPALMAMVASIPDYAHVRFPPNMKMRLDGTWMLYQRNGIKFECPSVPLNADGHPGAAEFIWNGPTNGTMVLSDRCGFIEIKGFLWTINDADVCIDIDQIASGTQINTQNTLRFNYFRATAVKNANLRIVRISNVSAYNCEYMRIEDNVFDGYRGDVIVGGIQDYPITVATTSGSNALVFSAPVDLGMLGPGQRVRIAGVGATVVNGIRSGLDTTIATVTDSTHATMSVNANATLSATYWMLGGSVGRGILNGLSYNAKRQFSQRNTFQYLDKGIDSAGGSWHSIDDNFFSVELAVDIRGNQSEPSTVDGLNSENSRAILAYTNPQPLSMRAARFSINRIDPINGVFTFNASSSAFKMESSQNDGQPIPTNTRIFDVRAATGLRLTTENNMLSGTPSEIGFESYPQAESYMHLSINDRVNGSPIFAHVQRGGRSVLIDSQKFYNRFDQPAVFGLSNYEPLDTAQVNGSVLGSTSPWLKSDAIMVWRSKKTDGTFANAWLPVDTSDFNITFGLLDASISHFGRRVRFDASGGSKEYQLRDASNAMPSGWWTDVYKVDSSTNDVVISVQGTALVNGTSGFKLASQYSGVRITSRGGSTYDATPLNFAPVTATWDPPSLATLKQDATKTVTVVGAAIGMQVKVGFSLDLRGLTLTGYVSSSNTVTVVLFNGTTGTVNLGSGTLKVTVNPLS
jgi:hypothetical protein